MTTEEKAIAYDEVLERAKNLLTTSVAYDRFTIEKIFPELRESEDEKIRKVLVGFFKSYKKQGTCGSETFNGIPTGNILAWLEKQGELTQSVTKISEQDWSEEDERLCQCLINDQEEALDKVRNDRYGHAEIISDLKEMYNERIEWLESLKKRFGG